MFGKKTSTPNQYLHFFAVARATLLVATITIAGTGVAGAYFGDSFINVPGTAGHWQGANYKNWIRVEVSYWPFRPTRLDYRMLEGDRMFFSGPSGPKPGTPSSLVISVSKKNPDLATLMTQCAKKAVIPELTYAESSDRARSILEMGPRPANTPDFWEYKLKDVEIDDCPVVADAPEQALVIKFKEIEWLNYNAQGPEATSLLIKPEDLPSVKPAEKSAKGKAKAFAITWIAAANEVSEGQCPQMNVKPTESDYYHLVPKKEAAEERVRLGEKGVPYGGLMEKRGPDRLNACKLPGIVRDPGFASPRSTAAFGMNLDGNDGTGQPAPGTCKHDNYTSNDARQKGIDNQLFRVMGCVAGFKGKSGYANQTSNTHRADGTITTLIEISGIDDEKNDDSVDVSIMYSSDHLSRDASGKEFFPDVTFRVSDKPQLAYYAVRLHGRIVDGVVMTDPVKKFQMNLGLDPLLTMFDSRMRLEILPNGNLRGVLGGYVDWRTQMEHCASSYTEGLFGYQCPGVYGALKRAADGMKDPVTGECNGISAAYEIDAVPAFLARAQPKVAKADVKVD